MTASGGSLAFDFGSGSAVAPPVHPPKSAGTDGRLELNHELR